MTRRLPSLRPVLAVVLTAAALAATATIWARVVDTISKVEPPVSTLRPTAIVWGDRVFQSRAELAGWLHANGASYRAWSRAHPVASAIIEHRIPAKPRVTRAEHTTTAAARAVTPAPQEPSSGPPSSTRFPFERVVVTLLTLLAALCAWAGSLPAALRRRYPGLALRVAPHRDKFLVGAAALVIGIVVGAALT